MQKTYSRINWKNDTDPPINETNLNKMDYALDEIDTRVVELQSQIENLNLLGLSIESGKIKQTITTT